MAFRFICLYATFELTTKKIDKIDSMDIERSDQIDVMSSEVFDRTAREASNIASIDRQYKYSNEDLTRAKVTRLILQVHAYAKF